MTEISVANCISDVLFERNRIILPGIGLLETKPKSAVVDHISNSVAPPSRDIGFNPNITADDGMLVSFIKKKYEKEDLVVRKYVSDYMSELRKKMYQKEIVTIPDVGRMYLDFEKKIQFLPDRVNYNKDSFGLPTVKFNDVKPQPAQQVSQPVAKTVVPATVPPVTNTPPQVSTAVNVPPPPANTSINTVTHQPVQETIIPPTNIPPQNNRNWLNILFPILIGLAIIAIGVVFYNLWADGKERQEEADKIAKYDNRRLNTKPEIEDDERAQYEEEYESEIIEKTNEGVTLDDDDELPDGAGDTDAPTIRPGTNEGVIIVGGFSSRRNAERLVQKIYKKGYDAYIDEAGPINRVGVTFAYDDEDDIVNMVRQLRREFDSSSWVLTPKGFKVD